jgi:hypothetical protein
VFGKWRLKGVCIIVNVGGLWSCVFGCNDLCWLSQLSLWGEGDTRVEFVCKSDVWTRYLLVSTCISSHDMQVCTPLSFWLGITLYYLCLSKYICLCALWAPAQLVGRKDDLGENISIGQVKIISIWWWAMH